MCLVGERLSDEIPAFDLNGNIPPVGIIRPTLRDFKTRFVDESQNPAHRLTRFNGYLSYCNRISSLGITNVQWVDGSYTTNIPEPGDVDILNHIDAVKLDQKEDAMDVPFCDEFLNLCKDNITKSLYYCHIQNLFVYPPNADINKFATYLKQRRRCKRLFSQDKKHNPKGIIELNIPNGQHMIGNA
jgi:hypothetical protein